MRFSTEERYTESGKRKAIEPRSSENAYLPGTGVKIALRGQLIFMASGWPGKGHGTLG